jgi:hypothetical protein
MHTCAHTHTHTHTNIYTHTHTHTQDTHRTDRDTLIEEQVTLLLHCCYTVMTLLSLDCR